MSCNKTGRLYLEPGAFMKLANVLSLLVVLCGFTSFSNQAMACSVSDIQNYYSLLIPGSECQNQGGLRQTIVARGESFLTADPSTVERSIALLCNNGDVLLGTVSLDSKSCQVKTVKKDTTVSF